ncbi:HAD family hydrolase [Spongiibacter sp. KMU-158]|uniref:Histidinol-phosphatase n=1 Tax=Spongiibacter pelagi TaxID=2760804 RepID=A0A927BYG3_9GAMM|nr:HAD family hydrolase [Spongiibacter pelagi]MBD2857878.1 HAD family hydrolase [Spongiibacter pelagi]
MALAIFDLDNTLLAGDSDHAWGEFLITQGLVDPVEHKQQNDEFYRQYQQGGLDIIAYLRFALRVLTGKSPAELAPLHQRFMQDFIEPMKLAKAQALIEKHRQAGDILMVITATNRFVTEPIVKSLGINLLLACDAEIKDGKYTGEPCGLPTFQHGKVTRLNEWLAENNETLAGSYFYSDSHNDLPLLQQVENPVAVDPDDTLRQFAEQAGWPVISLR